VRKDVGSDSTEYIYFNGQVIAEHKPSSTDWSDYVYANGKRMLRADNFDYDLKMDVTITAAGGGTGWSWYV